MTRDYCDRGPGDARMRPAQPATPAGRPPGQREDDARMEAVRERLREGGYDEPRVLAEVARRLLESGDLGLAHKGW